MTASGTLALSLSTLSTYGLAVLAIITAVIGIGVAYLVYKFGWRKVKGSLR